MSLVPIGELFCLKRRPETVLEVNQALQRPVETVADYVFTDNLRHQFNAIFDRVELKKGQGYWIRAQYGGGKTHLLATLAALLSGGDDVWAAAADAEIQAWRQRLKGERLFPVVFSLMGKGAVDQDVSLSLYDIFEQEITTAARNLLNLDIRLSTADEVRHWWDESNESMKDLVDRTVRGKIETPVATLLSDREAFKTAVLDATDSLGISIRMDAKIEDRLRSAYRQIVNPATGYTGILVIIDEFAYWQGQRPNIQQMHQDEGFLETIASKLPQVSDLQYTVIVASQQPPPRKLQDDRRYKEFLVAPGDAAEELWEYQQVVSHRVRTLREDRSPEIDEYYQDAIDRYSFGPGITRNRFDVMFPVEPTTYRILQRITASLTSDRVGINVVWEMLGDESASEPTVRPELLQRTRLLTTPRLLDSLSLKGALLDFDRQDRLDYLEAACNGLQHCDIDDEERSLARDIVETLFLWSIAYPNTNTPMPLDDLTAAVLAEHGIFNRPREAVESVLDAIQSLEQISFDSQAGTAEFVARATSGKPSLQIFKEYRARPLTDVDERWRKYLFNLALVENGLTPLFAGKETGRGEKVTVPWAGVEYEGRQLLSEFWKTELGADLEREDQFYRIVYLVNPSAQLGSDAIRHNRVAVCVPRDLIDSERDALRDVVALDQMEQDYASRSDTEALEVREYIRKQRPEHVLELMRQQRDHYRYGKIVTQAGLNIDPMTVFQQPKAEQRAEAIAEQLLDNAFQHRPFGLFKTNAPFNGPAAQNVFLSLFKNDQSGKARDAANNYAPGLGLSDVSAPTRLTGDNADALKLLRQWLDAVPDDQGLAVWEIYDRFLARGVPTRMATLFLLAFVRRVSEHAELTIKATAKLTLDGRHDTPISLTSGEIHLISTFSQVADGLPFERLAKSRQVPFGEAIDWLKAIDPTLKPTNSAEEIAGQGQRVVELARQLAEPVARVSATLQELGQAIGSRVPQDVQDALDVVASLSDITNFADIYKLAKDRYQDEDAFTQVINHFRAAEALAFDAGSIRAAHEYLGDLSGHLDGAHE